jgi:hypothetical protein
MTPERDFESRPYTPDEQRVVGYLAELVPEIGAGDDPIGFLIASHAALSQDLKGKVVFDRSEYDFVGPKGD